MSRRARGPRRGREERLRAADEAPPPPQTPITRPGDLWQIGPHRLLCGDSTNAKDIARLTDGTRPRLMVTDPPYGVAVNGAWRDGAARQVPGKSKTKYVTNDDRSDWSAAWQLFSGAVAYIWHGSLALDVAPSVILAGFELKSQIIWRKQQGILSRAHYHWQHECCLYAIRRGATAVWCGDRTQTTVWDITAPSGWAAAREDQTQHGTQKPVECMRRPILNSSKPGDAVYDPFLGSGTTMVAAQMESRICLGLEIDPGYCDVIVERMAKFGALKARRA